MAVVPIATATWAGVHGDVVARFYAPELPAEAGGAAVVLDGLEWSGVEGGEPRPTFGGGVLAVSATVAVDDPRGVLKAARSAAVREADVFCDLTVPTGRADLPAYVWRLLVTSVARDGRLSPDLLALDEVTVEMRCGASAVERPLGEVNGPTTTAGRTVAQVLADLLDLEPDHAPGRAVVVRLPVHPDTGGWQGPTELRFTDARNGEGEHLGRLVEADAPAYDALDTLCRAMTLAVYQNPDPATWRTPTGEATAAPGPDSAPVWCVVPRASLGSEIADAYATGSAGALQHGPVTVPADGVLATPATWLGDDGLDDLDALRAITFERTPGAAAAVQVVGGTYSDAGTGDLINENGSRAVYVGSLSPSPDLVFRLDLTAGYGDDPSIGGGRLSLYLEGVDGVTYYGRPGAGDSTDWQTSYAPALEGGDGLTADVSADTPVAGRVLMVVHGARDPFPPNALVEYREASVALVDPDTGDVAEVGDQVVTFASGYRGYTDSLPLLPPMERLSGGSFAPVQDWASLTDGSSWIRASEAQAAERAAQEGRPLRTFRLHPSSADGDLLLGLVTGPATRLSVVGGAAPFPGVSAVTTGFALDPVSAENEVFATEVGAVFAVAPDTPVTTAP